MTAYNVAPYVSDALRSALTQSFRDIEVIVVDDGSTDGTVDLIRSFDDSRIRVVRLRHSGAAAALNVGVSAARGEILAFLDGDDLWRRDKLARHIQVLREHPEIDLTFSWSRIINGRGADTGLRTKRCRGRISFSHLLGDYSIGTNSSIVVRRSVFSHHLVFDEVHAGLCFDVDVWLRVARLRPHNVACVPAILTDYRRRGGQLTKNLQLMERGWDQLLARMQQLAPQETARVARRARSNLSRHLALIAYENGRAGQALLYAGRGFQASPAVFLTDARNWKMLAGLAAALLMPASLWQRLLRAAITRQASRESRLDG